MALHNTGQNEQTCFGHADLASLTHWLEQLHRTNAEEYFQALSHACRDVAKCQDIRLPLALSLLDELRSAIQQHVLRLSRQYLHQSVDLPLKARRAADDAAMLWQVLGNAYYAFALHDRGMQGETDDGEPLKPAKDAIACLHRSLLCQQQILLQNIVLYRLDSPAQWQEFHQRYELARLRNVNEHRINDPSSNERPISCMTDLYAALCVLRISNCNQLNQLEIMTLWQFLQKFAVLIELHDDRNQTLYGIDIQSDLPPLRRQQLLHAKHVLGLDYQALLVEIDKLDTGGASEVTINKRLRTHLQRALSGEVVRGMPRHKSHGHVDIAFGLADTWYTFAHRRSLDDMTRNLNRHAALLDDEDNPFMKAKRETFLRDAWNDERLGLLNEHAEVASMAILEEIRHASLSNKDSIDIDAKLQRADVVEHSATGFCLSVALPLTKPIKNGDLLAIREQADDIYVVGTIRWVRSDQESVTFGVEVISPLAICFGARHIPPKGDIQREIFTFALLLPEIPRAGQAARILLPSVPFHEGSKVQLLRDELEILIRLESNQQSTFSHSLFEFSGIDDPMGLIPEIGQRVQIHDERVKALMV